MFLKNIHIENFRLLIDYDVTLDEELTLFVGKNNAGKTSLMNLIQMVVEGKMLSFNDYPIQCRKKVYELLLDFWNEKILFEDLKKQIPVTMIRFCIDYKKEDEDDYLGGISPFIIDLDESIEEAIVLVKYAFSMSSDRLKELKKIYDESVKVIGFEKDEMLSLLDQNSDIDLKEDELEKTKNINKELISNIIEEYFGEIFSLHIIAVNPKDENNCQEKSKKDLENLFVLCTISAERSLDEAEKTKERPMSAIMNRIFKTDVLEMEEEVAEQGKRLKNFVEKQSLKAENMVNSILSDIVENMISFGYPTGEDMQLYAKTQFSIKNDIINNTDLTYVTAEHEEALPSSHNGLGYKNLIKITLLLKEFSREVKENAKSAIPLLFLEEPEAHMHPQLQEVFVGHLKQVLSHFTGNPIQIVMSTHSPHIANTVPFKNIRYLKREIDKVVCKNLNEFYENKNKGEQEHKNNVEFLRKYLTSG